MEQKPNVKAAQHPAAPTSRAKARSTAEQGNEPFGDTAPDALHGAAASRALCSRNVEKETVCLINREALRWMRGELQCSSVRFSASSSSPPQAHCGGNGNRANNNDQIAPVTQHSFNSCVSKQLCSTEPAALQKTGLHRGSIAGLLCKLQLPPA